jgi:PhnB protein
MPAKPIPDGFHTVTPYLFAEGAPRLVEFISKAFHGEVIYCKQRSDGSVMHATMRIGDSMMLAEATNEFRPMPTSVYLYVPDCDTFYRQALEAGGSPSLTS